MKTVSMLEFRQNAEAVLRSLKRRQQLTLTYRGKPIARLEPIRERKRDASIDPIFRLHEWAQPSPQGPLDHTKIDRVVYGRS